MISSNPPEYLYRRSTFWYVRIAVPQRLRARFGRADFRFSLRTGELEDLTFQLLIGMKLENTLIRKAEVGLIQIEIEIGIEGKVDAKWALP